jgi:hypothetical protein
MELGDLPGHPARKASSAHKLALEHWLSDELKSRGLEQTHEAASCIVVALEGASVLALIHGDPKYFALAADIARRAVSSGA